jgi:hypothetical protein
MKGGVPWDIELIISIYVRYKENLQCVGLSSLVAVPRQHNQNQSACPDAVCVLRGCQDERAKYC